MVVVLFTGRPLAITKIQEEAPAILNAWFPGSEAGLAIADVLFGAVNPSGKLTATFPRNVGQVPLFYAHKNTGRPLDPAKTADCGFQKFTSNYLDVCNTPLYPFGFGLSYTTFSYSDVTLDKAELGPNDSITVSVKVKNTGDFDGKEVVQLYVRDVVRSTTPPVRELKGFKKLFLKKGEEQIVQFKLQTEDLKFYDTDLNFIAEPGEFQVFVGGDSTTELQNRFELVN